MPKADWPWFDIKFVTHTAESVYFIAAITAMVGGIPDMRHSDITTFVKWGGVSKMAQKITGYIKLQIPAGKATPAPPVGPALGQHSLMKKLKRTQVLLSLLLSQYIRIVLSPLLQKLRRRRFLSKRHARFRAVRVYRIRQRLHKSAKQTLKLLLNKKCPILTQLPVRQLCLWLPAQPVQGVLP